MKTRTSILLILLFIVSAVTAATLTTYPAPAGAPLNHDFSVRVRTAGGTWQTVDTYSWNVDRTDNGRHCIEKTSVAYFDFEGTVDVEVTWNKGDIQTARVRPLSKNIATTIRDNTVCFSIDKPSDLSVEVNGDIYHNLQLFANAATPVYKNARQVAKAYGMKSKDVIFYGSGYYDLGNDSIRVGSGQVLYVGGGAYVKGYASVWHATGAKIIGHGIVTPERQHEGIMVRYSSDVVVDGPITTQIPVGGSDHVSVRNAKVISWYGWGDGMNVFASNNVSYNHVFCRTSDDCSTIYCTRKDYHGGCRNISVKDAVYWADVAHPIMIGIHGDIDRHEVIEQVTYEDIDILQQREKQVDYQGCIAINDGDNIMVRDMTFRNIRIEDIDEGMLINFRVCYNRKYCHAPGGGIRNITLEDISYNGTHANLSLITGYDESRTVSGIHFKNLRINGQHISDNMPGKPGWYKTADLARFFIGEHVEDVTFE